MLSGILNINKPSLLTSSDVVGRVRRILGTRAVGHMGTLDPIGTGVLLVGVLKGTRLFDFYLSKSKTYLATFKFGSHYDTLDYTGTLLSSTEDVPSRYEIENALNALTGNILQTPPAYSAKNVGGVRAYTLARQGESVKLKPSLVTVNSFKLVEETGENEYLFEIDCSSGTYIRSLCRDLAEKLGSLAHMTSIKRARCGNFFITESVALEELNENDIIPLDVVLKDIPRFDVPDEFYSKLVNGIRPDCGIDEDRFTVYCQGELFGIGRKENGKAAIVTYLREGK